MKKVMKRLGVILLVLVLLVALVVGGYLVYLMVQYDRIADFTPMELQNPRGEAMVAGAEYTAVTFNMGFGAYDTDFSFFMDEGIMADGTRVVGTSSRAASQQAVNNNTGSMIATLRELDADFMLLQEVDEKADRSWNVNQVAALRGTFTQHSSAYASNFHTAYLFYPPTKPIGRSESGLVTFSRYEVTNPHRRSYPVDESFPTKFFDLDRCFTVEYIPVEGGTGDLVLINTHMSAYDEGGVIRAAQLSMLMDALAEERTKGNYVVVGGDYNHALGDTISTFPSGQQVPDWVVAFDEAALPEGFRIVHAGNNQQVATCRGADLPYTPGVNYTTVIDGFIVSDNVVADAVNIDAGFAASDHNPVLLRFVLAPAAAEPDAE